MRTWKHNQKSVGVTSTDPSVVFVIKALLNPVIAVLTLLLCLVVWGESLQGPWFLVAVLAFLGVADFLGVARLSGPRSWHEALRFLADIAGRWLLLTGTIWLLLHLSGVSSQISSVVLRTWIVIAPVAIWASQILASSLLVRPGSRQRNAVIVGVTDLGLRLESTLRNDPLLRIEVVGYFEDRHPERIDRCHAAKVLGSSATLHHYVLNNDVSIVYITLPMSRDTRIISMLEALRDSTVSVYFVPDVFVFNLIQARVDLMEGIPLVAVCESPFYGIRGLAKRISDVAIAGAAVLALSPVLALIAAGVRLTSAGPVIFRQKRYGLDGKAITVYKFRSMTVTEDGEHNYTQVSRNDSRLTSLGAFLRRTSLDELPQLFNVLEGSMSIVGPRPHAVAVNEQYRRLIPGYMVRHKVKPGITGWAQINGYRGGDDLGSMIKRVELDLEYLRHWSLWMDLVILVRTTVMVLTDRRAY